MNSILYVIAILLVIGWFVGFVIIGVGGLIHILLYLAIIAVVFRIISGRRPVL